MTSLEVFEERLRASVEAGKLTESQARVEFEKRRAWQDANGQQGIHQSQSQSPPDGPGTRLKTLLRDWLGIEATPTCSCNAMARKMNDLGPDWCEGDGMAEILGVMRDEHAKRWADGRTILPWTDAGARQLVLLACRRSRAKA